MIPGVPSSLRAQRSNPESFRGGILDCFAPLAMTESLARYRGRCSITPCGSGSARNGPSAAWASARSA
ncbi:hypothetical protein F8237_21380 [Bradyrhizobium betae]|uniref:Uncharacterized protein n=1 Tax=Bradyrhizobium betae TaxID=244734 RepID=A0A5P6P8Z9_9BRAD|nr:hypothetical protein F8237_21380 [Bradyrhizobium betae]